MHQITSLYTTINKTKPNQTKPYYTIPPYHAALCPGLAAELPTNKKPKKHTTIHPKYLKKKKWGGGGALHRKLFYITSTFFPFFSHKSSHTKKTLLTLVMSSLSDVFRSVFSPLVSAGRGDCVVSASEDGSVHFFQLTKQDRACINKLQVQQMY